MKHYKTIKGGRLHGCSIEHDGTEYRVYDAWDRLIGTEDTIRAAKSVVREFICNSDRQYEEYNVPASAKRLRAFYKPAYLRA